MCNGKWYGFLLYPILIYLLYQNVSNVLQKETKVNTFKVLTNYPCHENPVYCPVYEAAPIQKD